MVALGIGTLGIPLPGTVKKQSSEPFPCMNCPCGCKTAEKCWRDCCCHTLTEKLAWARDNGVTPPAYVLAAAKVAIEKKEPNCCLKKTATLCCSTCTEPECCAKPKCSGGDQVCHQTRLQTRRPKASIVLVIQSRRCQGLTSSLTTLPPSVMPTQVVHAISTPPAGEVNLLNEQLSPSPFDAPDTPPPQSA
jgi:hypothetical protein